MRQYALRERLCRCAMRNRPRAKRTRLIIGEVSEMVQTPIERNTSEERQEVIDWLLAHHYPVLPVAPAQSLWKYHKVAQGQPEQGVWTHCHLTADLQPIPLYTRSEEHTSELQ